MIVHNHEFVAELMQPYIRYLMSDLHLGSPASDHDRVTADLQRAKDNGARVLINGDVFDWIGPKDPRYESNVLHPRLRGKKDLGGAIIDLGYDILHPFADIIDFIGVGNHEEAAIKHGYSDPIARLIAALNAGGKGVQIAHGSFWGYYQTHFKVGKQKATHRLLYFHGVGGDSPVGKGTSTFARKGRNWRFDALTFGHAHNIAIAVESIMDVTPSGKVFEHVQLNLETGSYYRNYKQLDQSDPLDYGYAASKAHQPKPIGGIFLTLRPIMVEGVLMVKQDYASDIIVPWTKRRRSA